MEKIKVLGVNFSNLKMTEVIDRVLGYLKEDRLHTIYTPNPEILMRAEKDEEFRAILNVSDLVIPDGIGVIIASKILGNPLKERVPGYDTVQNIFGQVCYLEKSVYFLGAGPGIAETAAKNMAEKYPGLKIAGFRDGYFKPEDEEKVIEEINKTNPDILIVGFGAPKQEKFIFRNREKLNAKIAIGAGGSIDGMSGKFKRAPLMWQKMGFEWLYRVILEPKRIKRIAFVIPAFLIKIFILKLKGDK
ncbi:MAG: WecB/TagA/CpsF family glycosyltransferase [Clostridia bacterium]|nr:WecB/TagA/CpsF family glycosyltransferase [Clostridia bacterium]